MGKAYTLPRAVPDAWRAPPAKMPREVPPGRGNTRIYAGARQTAQTGGFGSYANNSADAELLLSLTQLRARSRQLMRDAPYAKRARVIVTNNVIFSGVGLQAQVKNTRGQLHAAINADVEEQFGAWSAAENCHTGGALHFADFERACCDEVFTAGEVIIRKHYAKFGDSAVPLALELVEAERIADEMSAPVGGVPGVNMNLGIEVDEFGRAVAYWIRSRHLNELRPGQGGSKVTRVPAEQIIHLRLVNRWPQTRGEPWLHGVLRKLNNMEEYTASELLAARMGANYFATIESPDENPLPTEVQEDNSKAMDIEAGMIDQLAPGDELKFHAPNRPNTALDPFMRYMLREIASGVGVSYESLSRDYSQSNYSSSRLSLLDDRDLWRVLQQWWARSFREPLHRAWLAQAVLARAVASIPLDQYMLTPERFAAVRWKFRGWSWVDPTKEVRAYKEAVGAGFTTISAVIAATGGGVDLEDVIAERQAENKAYEAAGFDVDWTVTEATTTAEAMPVNTEGATADAGGDATATDTAEGNTTNDNNPAAAGRVVNLKEVRNA